MKLHLQSDSGVTLIENVFIDQYMAGANGEFVKLYLYLLRCAGTGRDLSVSSIADFFDHTEKDVRRALSYWEKMQLLKLRFDGDDNITDIIFSGYPQAQTSISREPQPESTPAPEPVSDPVPGKQARKSAGEPSPEETPVKELPSRAISAARRSELKEQAEIRQLIFVQQEYTGRPLTSAEVNNLLYFYEKLQMSVELIDYLIDYCATKGNPGTRYMEKVAQEWYLEGVKTVADAKQASASHRKEYYSVFRALGLGGRSPAPSETAWIDRWLEQYAFSLEIILEACDRTIRQTHQASFDYIDSILKSWSASGVRTLDDIRNLDEEHQQKKKNGEEKHSGVLRQAGGRRRSSVSPGLIQRDYDWSRLEQQLLQAQSAAVEESTN